MNIESNIMEIVKEVKAEMKRCGFWKINMPAWVTDYEKKEISSQQDFADWLQFVYLPNISVQTESIHPTATRRYVALQAKKFLSEDVKKGRLLQLLIELDSLL
jgi:uncharacterized protein YqcC (DUF446 family)